MFFRVHKHRRKTRRNKVRQLVWAKKRKCMLNPRCKGAKRIKELLNDEVNKHDKQVTGVRQAAWRCRRNLPIDPEKRNAVLSEINRLEGKVPLLKQSPLSQACRDRMSLTQSLLNLTKFKAQQKFEKVEKIAKAIKKKYKSYRAAHRCHSTLSLKRWHAVCKPKKIKFIERRVSESERKEMLSIWENEDVCIPLPFKRLANKKFMIITVCQAYQKYIMQRKNKGARILSMSSFYRTKPKNVKPRRCLPLNLCTCAHCANFSLNRDALISNKIQGITRKSSTAACNLLCPNNSENFDIKDHKRDCIYGKCSECSPEKIKNKIKSLNPEVDWKKAVTWHRWKSIKKIVNNKECSGFERVSMTGTLDELLDAYITQGKEMPLHLLNMEWQRGMYCDNRDILEPGNVQLVIDYAKNYAHVYQNEPQSAHWDRQQTTLHPISATYLCPEKKCDENVTDEVVCISPDLGHDIFGVETYVSATLDMLKKSKVPVKRLYEWSDNATMHYKSRYSYEIISCSPIPRMRSFYGENHGKSAADGIVGRLKMEIDLHVRTGTVIQNAEEFYQHCVATLATKPAKGCQHFRKHFLYCPDIERPEEHENARKVPDISKTHCVRTTGHKGVLELRALTCLCVGCRKGTTCTNSHIVVLGKSLLHRVNLQISQ